jgi:hypothetical protein
MTRWSGGLTEPVERLAHGQLGRLQDVDRVDHVDLHAADADGIRSFEDALVEGFAARPRDDL